jgi:hypothetical protein
MCAFSVGQNRGHTHTARAITQIMKEGEVTPATPQLRQDSLEASATEPREAATLPAVPAVSAGREYFAMPDRTRSDGGPIFDSVALTPFFWIATLNHMGQGCITDGHSEQLTSVGKKE